MSEVENEVKESVGDGGEASTPETPEDVSSPEVKVEEPVVKKTTKSVEELQTQINNLNIALIQERGESKTKSEQFETQLEEYKNTNERLKNVFSPVEESEEVSESSALTREQMEEFYEKKSEQEKQKKFEEDRVSLIQKEIKELSKEWDGKDGKPKYDDNEIIDYQKDNNVLHLSPKQAFREKYHKELIDFEVKQRIAGKVPVENVEKPSAQNPEHTPKEKEITDTRSAIIEAMNNAEKEM